MFPGETLGDTLKVLAFLGENLKVLAFLGENFKVLAFLVENFKVLAFLGETFKGSSIRSVSYNHGDSHLEMLEPLKFSPSKVRLIFKVLALLGETLIGSSNSRTLKGSSISRVLGFF